MVRAMYDTNVFGVMDVCRAVLPIMRKQGSGCIINITSMAGMVGLPLETAYSGTKYAVEGMTEAALGDLLEDAALSFEQVEPLGELTLRWTAERWSDENLATLGADYDR